jgi:hypothetical protein
MYQMKAATQAAKAQTKALHDRAVDEIIAWIHKTRGIMASRVTKQQEYYGDFFFQIHPQDRPTYVLVKAEEENRFGNFFIETWRNKSAGEGGWITKNCIAKFLGYYFHRDKELYMIKFQEFRKWAEHNITRFPEKEQSKRIQENDAWGRVVPIQVVEHSVTYHKYILS